MDVCKEANFIYYLTEKIPIPAAYEVHGSLSVCLYLLYVLLLYVVSRVEAQVIERMRVCCGPLIMDEDHRFNLGLAHHWDLRM